MKFSIIYEAQTVDTTPEAEFRVFHEMVEQSLLAEKVGFDCIWAVEHTALTQYAHMSAPESFLAFLAGKTERIHLGHGVVCLPPHMNHPVKVAERIATLDILSKGRLEFGMGKGGSQQEAGTFGYDLKTLQPMIDEAMYLIPKIMTQEYIEHTGTYVQIPRRPIYPKPYQKPHPKLYYACTNPTSLELTGKRGIGALVLGLGGPDDVARKNALYREAFRNRSPADQVGQVPNEHLAALCLTIVLDDREKARRIGLKGQRFFTESLNRWYAGGPAPKAEDYLDDPDEQLKALSDQKEKIVAFLASEKIEFDPGNFGHLEEVRDAYGTVDDCIRYVQRLFAAGADEILFLMQMGTVPHEAILETIRNIGEHVIPHFRSKGK
jgi:alkanesulfonate monooxygenase SsuD/methylene tetrahydromethanopterin reductase-like flavin-dependent oxidoreductase (luciferase family)